MQGAAGQLIAEIRRESGFNQAELARRAGLPASVLSAYARGRRQPGVDALARIAAAADLAIRIDRRADQAERERAGEAPAQVPWLADGRARRRRASPVGSPRDSAAERLERTRKAWERGGDEGKQLDRLRARRMSHEQRIDEGLALARIAEQLQAGRQAR